MIRLPHRRELQYGLVLFLPFFFLFHYYLLYWPLQDTDISATTEPLSSNALRHCISTAHREMRYVKPNVCVTIDERRKALEDLVYALKVMLENAHVVYWIDSGTLLGVYRAQQLVPWDYNADIGITVTGFQYLRATSKKTLEVPENYELTAFNSSLYDAGETSTAVPVKFVDMTFGFYANMHVFIESEGPFKDNLKSADASIEDEEESEMVEDEGIVENLIGPEPSEIWYRCIHCPVTGGNANSHKMNNESSDVKVTKHFRIPKNWVFPLRVCKMEIFEVMCPAQVAPYLMYIFGNRFLTPELWE